MLKYAFLRENPNYIIYNDGRLFSIKSGKFIKPTANQIRIAKCDIKTHEILEIYDSIRIASKANNCSEQNIGQVINGKQLSAKGYYWKKVN